MNCKTVRKRLLGGVSKIEVQRHIEECEKCAQFSERFERVLRALGETPARAIPRPDFAARVVALLPVQEPTLGWAAVRLLPASATLLVVLVTWAWLGSAAPSKLTVSSPTDDLVAWVLSSKDGNGND